MDGWRDARRPGAIAIGVALLVGCGGSGDDPHAVLALSDADRSTALEVYERESCGMCHGPGAEGTELAPALQDVAGYWDEDRIVRYLENPEAFREANPSFDERRDEVYDVEMPAYDHVSDAERRALARWLLTR